jgi:hypothetical protein
LLLLAAALAGCAGSGSGASYVQSYERGRYERASADAIDAVRDPASPDRELARLTAGLSAHALGRDDEAALWLRPLTTSEDDAIAGKAMATLGLISLADGEHRTAAGMLSRAAGRLRGNDSARSAMFAGDAYANIGSFDAARLQHRLAQASATDAALKREIMSRLGDGFTLQVGAFASRTNAERSRNRLEHNRLFESLGSPVVLERTDDRGARLFLVQVGRFTTQRDARAAQQRTGIGGIVTIAAADAPTG